MQENILDELKARESLFHHPHKSDATKEDILNMICDEFWEVGASGAVYTRQDAIKILLGRYNDPHYQDNLETKDFKLMFIALDTYLLTYMLVQDNTRITRRSTIWRREHGMWKILYHQGTVVRG